jgi:hypothetical protein
MSKVQNELLNRLGVGLIGLLLTILGWNINRGIVSIEGQLESLQAKERSSFGRLEGIERDIQYLRERKR